MSENKNPFGDFLDLGDNGDVGNLFAELDFPETPAEKTEPQTPAQTETASNEPAKQESKAEVSIAEGKAAPAETADVDPFAAALAKAQEASNQRLAESFAAKPAVFTYGKAKDPIEDKDCTFEELRQKYEGDFPELSDAKRVTWTVTYGKSSKTIANPGSDRVYEIKEEIEKSKTFLDGIKKAKKDEEKNPECIIKPSVRAQSKGKIIRLPEYKDFQFTESDARASDKPIVLLPSKDGRIYQMRKTPVGVFTAPAENIKEFDEIQSGFHMCMPKIPFEIFFFILNFFRAVSDKYAYEALAHILYDTNEQRYVVKIPKQRVSHASVNSVMDSDYPDHLIHVMDIHSHNTMPAEFSGIDDDDEKATRLYGVIGRLDRILPDIKIRAGCAGSYIYLKPEDIFDVEDADHPYPTEWDEQIEAMEMPKFKGFFPKRLRAKDVYI